MPTATEEAAAERDFWADLSGRWTDSHAPELWNDRPPTETSVVVFFDPIEDLERRARRWGHGLAGADLASLSEFAAGLASVEARSWSQDAPQTATQAYEARRFLVGDRLIHWAVPWLDSVGRCFPMHRLAAHDDRDRLLEIAETMRVAPATASREGLYMEGEDSFGPMEIPASDMWFRSLWSGDLIFDTTLGSMSEAATSDLTVLYEVSAGRWDGFAERYPGSAQIWLDLSERAVRTAQFAQQGRGPV